MRQLPPTRADRHAQAMHPEIAALLARSPVVARRNHPQLASRLSRAAHDGALTTLLPGVYALPTRAQDLLTRAAAACCYDPIGVIAEDAAAALSYWPDLAEPEIVVAGARHRVQRPGFRFEQRAIPRSLVRTQRDIRVTAPELTALDQVAQHGGEGIDRALRSRRVTLTQLKDALSATHGRRGNAAKRVMVLDSRDAPWSELERRAHRLLRAAGITGWSSNVLVDTAVGEYIVDIAFHRSPLCIEFDGREHHGDSRFDNDRLRGNELLLAGRIVLHFTWLMVDRHPELVVGTVQRALKALDGASLGPLAKQ